MKRPITIVAIPARNEAGHIADCLAALGASGPDHIVVLVNNTTDNTAEIARSVRLPGTITRHVIEKSLPPGQGTAGYARHLAMEIAARLAGEHGVLMTTDADGQVDTDWVSANLGAIASGADAVAGWVELHPLDWARLPARLHEDDAQECAYDNLCDRIQALLDPDPFDPLPRHTQNAGASLAVTAQAYRSCGGMPRLACGEDRAFIAALRCVDARIRHAPEAHVVVSGRIEGRSAGGMADTIRRRLTAPDEYADDRLEPASICALRARLRHEWRTLYRTPQHLSPDHAPRFGVDMQVLEAGVSAPYFGAAWNRIEASSTLLRRRKLRVADLAAETRAATEILAGL